MGKEAEEQKREASEAAAAAEEEAADAAASEAAESENDGASEGDVKDKHGQPGINKERHDKEMAEKDAKIAELQAQIDEASKTEEGRKNLQEEIEKLKAEQAEERVNHKLEMAGCVNAKAAKALLDDYDGDVTKLKDACPYLFEGEKKSGSTGGKPAGAASTSVDDILDKSMKIKKG